LSAEGRRVHVTAEPSTGAVGQLAYSLTDVITGPALACLYAADRYHHLEIEIRPKVRDGKIVLCDRYVPSTLVMQRLDKVALRFLWNLNALADRPDLAVILTGRPEVVAARLENKGPHNRLQEQADSTADEARFYLEAAKLLAPHGYPILTVNTDGVGPQAVAERIYRELARLRPSTSGDDGMAERVG